MKFKIFLFFIFLIIFSSCIVEQESQISVNQTLLLRYNFEEGGPPIAYDSSNFGNNGNISGNSVNLTYKETGKTGYAYNWRNNSTVPYSYIRVNTPDAIHNLTDELTITGWLYHNSNPTGVNMIIAKVMAVNGYRSFYLQMNGAALQFYIYWNSSTGISTVSVASLPLNQWVFFTAVYKYVQNGTSIMQLYVNGGLSSQITTAGGPIYKTPLVPVTIGSDLDATGNSPTANRYRGGTTIGKIDDLRIYSKALTIEEIAKVYNGQ